MGLFEFILILVFIVVAFEAGTKLLVPVARRFADLLADMVEERRELRRGPPPAELSDRALEEIENRLARIEDRLEFMEQLKAPDDRSSLPRP
jgi:hypothetical protein